MKKNIFVKILKSILYFFIALFHIVWGFPQFIISIFALPLFALTAYLSNKNNIKIHKFVLFVQTPMIRGGISFGPIVYITDNGGLNSNPTKKDFIYRHEFGHSIQSLMFGPLYLIVIGIPSLLRAIKYNKLYRQYKYDNSRLDTWYHSGYPENFANNLGNIFY